MRDFLEIGFSILPSICWALNLGRFCASTKISYVSTSSLHFLLFFNLRDIVSKLREDYFSFYKIRQKENDQRGDGERKNTAKHMRFRHGIKKIVKQKYCNEFVEIFEVNEAEKRQYHYQPERHGKSPQKKKYVQNNP